jgi:hypothetical protein
MTKLVIDWTQQPSKEYRWAEDLLNKGNYTDPVYTGWCIQDEHGNWAMYHAENDESWTPNAEGNGSVKIHHPPLKWPEGSQVRIGIVFTKWVDGVEYNFEEDEWVKNNTGFSLYEYQKSPAGFKIIERPIDTPYQLGALEDDITELYELTAKAARRLNYDFKHAIDLVPSESLRNGFISRFEMYSTIFEAGSGAKDYRHRLHRTIAELEFKIESLKGQLTEAGINPAPESPF